MEYPTDRIPRPSKQHATCVWCAAQFTTIVELIDHVDVSHVAAAA